MDKINTHNIKIDFGKHKDTLVTRLPISYIRWMINELGDDRKIRLLSNDHLAYAYDSKEFTWKDIAKAELERRGDTLPKVEISNHAIDKASLRVLEKWKDFNKLRNLVRNSNHPVKKKRDFSPIGLYSWLSLITLEALQHNDFKNDKYHYLGMKLVIEKGNEYPLLKTIMT